MGLCLAHAPRVEACTLSVWAQIESIRPDAEAILAGVATWNDVPRASAELGALEPAPVAFLFGRMDQAFGRSTPGSATVQITLQRVSTADLVGYLELKLDDGFSESELHGALEVLGQRSEPSELEWLLRLADLPVDPADRATRAKSLEQALDRRLRTRESDLGLLPDRLRGTSDFLAAPAVRAIADRSSPARGQALCNLLGVWPSADAFILHSLEQALDSIPTLDSISLGDVRRYLDSGQPEQAGLACRVLSACRDEGSLETWIKLLASPSPSVRSEAHRALRSVVGLPLGVRPDAWQSWLDEERAWWRTESDGAKLSLEFGTATEAVAAVRAVSLMRTRSEELCELLALALDRREVGIAELAARGLAAQASPRAQELLILALGRPRPEVRAVALESLRRRTGLELGPEPERWRRALTSAGTER